MAKGGGRDVCSAQKMQSLPFLTSTVKRTAMSQNIMFRTITAIIISALFVSTSPALAGKPSGDSGKKNEQHEQKGKHAKDKGHEHKGEYSHGDRGKNGHFEERQQIVVRKYYEQEFNSGHCPPGLKKKHNGCMPPGQAKKWVIGRPLPPDVIYYDLPEVVIVELGPPPIGHRYVRVAGDILMIATGTAMVMDAIQDLSR